MDNKTILRFDGGVDVSNLDEIKAHLTNELNRLMKPLFNSLNQIILATKENKPIKSISVENQPDPIKDISVNNLSELKEELANILEAIKSLPAPEVTVNPPEVNVQAPIVNVPAPIIPENKVDLTPILKELNLGLNKLRTNAPERPLVVRLKEGQEILSALNKLQGSGGKGGNSVVAFSQNASFLADSTGAKINPATTDSTDTSRGELSNQSVVAVGTSATAVSLTNGKKAMTIQNIGTAIIYIGGSGVTSSAYAFKIVPMQIFDFGKVKAGFKFYAICATATSSSIGVAEYA